MNVSTRRGWSRVVNPRGRGGLTTSNRQTAPGVSAGGQVVNPNFDSIRVRTRVRPHPATCQHSEGMHFGVDRLTTGVCARRCLAITGGQPPHTRGLTTLDHPHPDGVGRRHHARPSPANCLFTPTVTLSPRSKETVRTHETNDARTHRSRVSSVHQRGRPLMHLLLWCPTQSSCCSSDSGVGAAGAPVARGASTTMQTTTEHDTTTTDEPTAITAATDRGEAA